MIKHTPIRCNFCNKPVYPIELRNNNRKTWCSCERVGIPDGWSSNTYKFDIRSEDEIRNIFR